MNKPLRTTLLFLAFLATPPILSAQVWQQLLYHASDGRMIGLATDAAGEFVLARQHPWYTPAWRFSAAGMLLDTLPPPVGPNGLERLTDIDTTANGGFLLAVNLYQTGGTATEGQVWEWRPDDTVVYRGGTPFREITALAHLADGHVLATWNADAGSLDLVTRTPDGQTALAQTQVSGPVQILINGSIPHWVTGPQRVTALTVDADGHVYVTGWRIGQPQAQGGQSIAPIGFVARYSAGLDLLGHWWSDEPAGYFESTPTDLQVAPDGTVWMLTRQGRLRRLSADLDAVMLDLQLPADSCYNLLPVPSGDGFWVGAVHDNAAALFRYNAAGDFISEKITPHTYGTIVNLRSVLQPDGIVQAAEFFAPPSPDTLPDFWIFKLGFDSDFGTTGSESAPPAPVRVRYWPNPAVHTGYVDVEASAAADLSLFDATGRRVWHTAAVAGRAIVPLRGLPRGAYWLGVEVSGKVYRYKWLLH